MLRNVTIREVVKIAPVATCPLMYSEDTIVRPIKKQFPQSFLNEEMNYHNIIKPRISKLIALQWLDCSRSTGVHQKESCRSKNERCMSSINLRIPFKLEKVTTDM